MTKPAFIRYSAGQIYTRVGAEGIEYWLLCHTKTGELDVWQCAILKRCIGLLMGFSAEFGNGMSGRLASTDDLDSGFTYHATIASLIPSPPPSED